VKGDMGEQAKGRVEKAVGKVQKKLGDEQAREKQSRDTDNLDEDL
jgi:uncharacterized protein YjbJ (UPF0337 family)